MKVSNEGYINILDRVLQKDYTRPLASALSGRPFLAASHSKAISSSNSFFLTWQWKKSPERRLCA